MTAATQHHRPRKRFGQHFLHDPGVIRRIMDAIEPAPGKHIVEIGPGCGALTAPLLAAGCDVDAIEIDRDLAATLAARCGFSSDQSLRVHCGDVLECDLGQFARTAEPIEVIGNLPYNVSTPLLFHLFSQLPRIRRMTFMLQDEVVERMAALAGNRDYGRLSVMTQYHCRVEPLFQVSPGAFKPPPRVNSAIVRLIPWRTSETVTATEPSLFADIVRRAFTKRRKMLRNALRGICTESDLLGAGIDPNARPEVVDVQGYVRLANLKSEPAGGVM